VSDDLLNQAADLMRIAREAGADVASTGMGIGTSLSVQRRLGKVEETERAESRGMTLRVFVGQKVASVSAGSIDPAAFQRMAEQAVAMARVVPDDIYDEIPEAPPPIDAGFLELDDPVEPDMATLIGRAAAAEDSALAVTGITNSEGASAGWGRSQTVLVTSRGFAGAYTRSSHGMSISVIAGSGTGMQVDYDSCSAVHGADLEDAAAMGRRAADQALARLNPVRPKTAKLPVVFDPRVSGGLIGHLSSAISGATIARGTSFLREKLGARIFSAGIDVIDDPLRVRGLRSRSFDSEGQRVSARKFIEDGVLTSWILGTRSANQLGLKTTGNAGGTSNWYMAPGRVSPAALMADIAEGLYVTGMMGMGINGLTGDYSRGAHGFMIRNGVLAEPVAEITIAGNLLEMFAALVPADDLTFKRGTNAPTIRIDGMVMAGG
jgi:PmbA protein